jgi:hypothetical protein
MQLIKEEDPRYHLACSVLRCPFALIEFGAIRLLPRLVTPGDAEDLLVIAVANCDVGNLVNGPNSKLPKHRPAFVNFAKGPMTAD